MPERDAATRSLDETRRRRGYSSLIVSGTTGATAAPATTSTVLGV